MRVAPLRIAMVSPLEMRVPPIAYGGTELVVSLLTEELVRRGHDVTLYAAGDAITSAKLVSVCPTFLRGSGRDSAVLTMLNVADCLEHADDFDIIHNHTLLEGMATAGLVDTPMLTTLHGGLDQDTRILFRRYQGWYCTISRSAKELLPSLTGGPRSLGPRHLSHDRFAGVVYNAIDAPEYPFNPGPREDYLLFLSRISEEKGPHIAIEVARMLGKRLVIAGNVNEPDRPFFESQVLPKVDGDRVRYIGEVDYPAKKRLLNSAACLLAPITWNEPFGLFMAEANVCGMPVIVFHHGSAPEVVRHGVTGFVVETPEEMAAHVERIREIDPAACRRHVEECFNVARMTDDYLAAYALAIKGASRSPALSGMHVSADGVSGDGAGSTEDIEELVVHTRAHQGRAA